MKHSHPTIRQQRKKPSKYDHSRPVVIVEAEEVPRKPKPKPFIKKEPPPVKLDVTAVVVNFKTLALIKQAVQTFRRFYPAVPLIVIDNASKDDSAEWIKSRVGIRTIINERNIGHGPALHQGMMLCKTEYVFTFDSDIKFNRGGFLEKMQQGIQGKYAIGWLRRVNRNGVAANGNFDNPKLCPYVHPCFALFDLEVYKVLSPFINKGAPLVENMFDAKDKGVLVAGFPFEKYAEHLIAGTRRLYRGHWFAKDRQPEQEWEEDVHIPI